MLKVLPGTPGRLTGWILLIYGERIFIHKAGYYAEVEESSAGNTFVEVLRQSIIAREG